MNVLESVCMYNNNHRIGPAGGLKVGSPILAFKTDLMVRVPSLGDPINDKIDGICMFRGVFPYSEKLQARWVRNLS